MKKNIIILLLLFISQFSFAIIGHFVFEYTILEDGVYGGTLDLKKIEVADPLTFEFIDARESSWGLVVTYAKDKNRVYHYTNVVAGADPKSFEKLDKWYAKDKKHVYNARKEHKIYKNYDAKSFEILGNWFVKDKNGVYYEHNLSKEAIKIKNIDPASFKILWGTYYLKDKKKVYYYEEKDGELTVKVLKDANPDSFVIEDVTSPYARDSQNVYWNREKLVDADGSTFKLIMRTSYGTDGKNVYYQSTKLEDADPNKFKVKHRNIAITDKYVYFNGTKLEGLRSDNYTCINGYIKNDSIVYYRNTRIKDADATTFKVTETWAEKAEDKNNRYVGAEIDKKKPILFGVHESGVYFRNEGSQPLSRADPATFKILNKYYGKDKKTVYWFNHKVENADAATFNAISESLGEDKTGVYYGKDRVVGANPKTYILLGGEYGKDDKNAFHIGKVVKNVDLSSFEVIYYDYAGDKNNIFFQDSIIENADYKSFKKVDYLFSKDKNKVYFESKIIENADPASFETFSSTYKNYSRDKDHVFFENAIVEGADPETFEMFIGSDYWIDKDHVFINGMMLENSDARTFEYFHDLSSYCRDKNNVYYNNKITGADRASFRIIGNGLAIDKNHVYSSGQISDQYDVKTFNIKDTYH